MKILLVSDIHHFSTYDVFNGYSQSLSAMKIPFDTADMTELCKYYNHEMAWGLVLAKAMNADNQFTHILYISGIVTPDWLMRSKRGMKVGIIALDDPHASKITLNKKTFCDYYFTNEKKIADKHSDTYYLPTATSAFIPNQNKKELDKHLKQDICFIGTVYDDRIKPLEEICHWAMTNKKTVKIIGPLLKTPQNSIIRKFGDNRIITNDQTKMMYIGSNLVINMDRNINWNPYENKGNSTLEDIGEPYSANPRLYEIGACKTPQLYINPRKEALDLFGDNIFSCGYGDINKKIESIFNTHIDILKTKTDNCFKIVQEGHTYINRTIDMLKYITQKDKT